MRRIGCALIVAGVTLFSACSLYADANHGYAVASAHPLATNAGLAILAQGGNAFDAAVAVSAALAVVEPYHSGLGGGGFWLLHLEKDKKNIFIDGREVAPGAATQNMYIDGMGNIKPGLSLNGPLAAAIPGMPAAITYLAAHYGRLPLKESLAPAIALAEKGFAVDYQYIAFIQMSDRLKQLSLYPASSQQFLNKGKPYALGEILKQPDLAKTLKAIAVSGHDGFYKGDVAQNLVNAVVKAGGIWSLKDLSDYQIKVREPLAGAYHNMLVITAPPPSAGGVALLTSLNILSHFSSQTETKAQWIHDIIEAMRLSYWQRMQYLGDPDFVKVPTEQLISMKNANQLLPNIKHNEATPSELLKKSPQNDPLNPTNTTHFSIMDKEGNRVSATLSINYIFGSSFVAEGTGVLLNDEMDDFTTKVGAQNVFGLMGGEANSIAPGKRPLSSMTPTFLEMPNRIAILGTPGGSRIATMVLLGSLSFFDYGGAISIVSAMRFHHQYMPDWVEYEPETFSPTLISQLTAMGYKLNPLTTYYGDMQAITWEKLTGVITAASDPRHIGMAAVVN